MFDNFTLNICEVVSCQFLQPPFSFYQLCPHLPPTFHACFLRPPASCHAFLAQALGDLDNYCPTSTPRIYIDRETKCLSARFF